MALAAVQDQLAVLHPQVERRPARAVVLPAGDDLTCRGARSELAVEPHREGEVVPVALPHDGKSGFELAALPASGQPDDHLVVAELWRHGADAVPRRPQEGAGVGGAPHHRRRDARRRGTDGFDGRPGRGQHTGLGAGRHGRTAGSCLGSEVGSLAGPGRRRAGDGDPAGECAQRDEGHRPRPGHARWPAVRAHLSARRARHRPRPAGRVAVASHGRAHVPRVLSLGKEASPGDHEKSGRVASLVPAAQRIAAAASPRLRGTSGTRRAAGREPVDGARDQPETAVQTRNRRRCPPRRSVGPTAGRASGRRPRSRGRPRRRRA